MPDSSRINQQAFITVIWLLSLIAGVGLILGLLGLTDPDNKNYFVYAQVAPALATWATIYGVHLAVILGCWFGKPLKQWSGSQRTERWRFLIASFCALLFNAMLLWGVAAVFFDPNSCLMKEDCIGTTMDWTKKYATAFSFLVIPANYFYFGALPQADR